MKNSKNSAKLLLVVTYLLLLALLIFVIFLPKGAYWYTDIKHRPETLPTVIISTCYPCVPFAVAALWSLRGIAKSILEGNVFTKGVQKSIFVLAFSCLAAGIIMFAAGFFYFPFFVSSGGALLCALFAKVFADLFSIHIKGNECDETAEDKSDSDTEKED